MLWCDGRLYEAGLVPFDLSDRGLLLGDGVFDTALAIGGRIAFEEAHVARLCGSLARLGIEIRRARITEAMRAVAAAAPITAIRTTVTRGPGPRGITPPASARPFLFASGAPVSPGLAFSPLALHCTEIRRNDTSPLSRMKALGYLDAVLAARDAAAEGCADALFLNTSERVACTGTGNLFALLSGALVTPPITEGVLPGVTRAVLLGVAEENGIAIEVRPLLRDELGRAEAVFATNSLRLLAPVEAIGGMYYESTDHPVVTRLSAALRSAICQSCDAPKAALG